jgi:hypothetical protein
MPEKYKCPGCKQFKDVSMFSARPVDERCDVCLPVDQAMVAMDKKVQLAGNKWAAILDKVRNGQELVPVERMLQTGYEQWGGEQQFMHDGVQCVKDLADAEGARRRPAHDGLAQAARQGRSHADGRRLAATWTTTRWKDAPKEDGGADGEDGTPTR